MTDAIINQWAADVERLERRVAELERTASKYRDALEKIANGNYRWNEFFARETAAEALQP